MEFRCPAGEIQTTDRSMLEHRRDQRHQLRTHHFGPGGTGIDMAVAAALVAAVTEVDLKGGEHPALKGGKRQGTGDQHQRVQGIGSFQIKRPKRGSDRCITRHPYQSQQMIELLVDDLVDDVL